MQKPTHALQTMFATALDPMFAFRCIVIDLEAKFDEAQTSNAQQNTSCKIEELMVKEAEVLARKAAHVGSFPKQVFPLHHPMRILKKTTLNFSDCCKITAVFETNTIFKKQRKSSIYGTLRLLAPSISFIETNLFVLAQNVLFLFFCQSENAQRMLCDCVS